MITVKEMRKLERYAASRGILPIELMQNAGKVVYDTIKSKFDVENKHIIIFTGPGNNGGDGFVAGKHFLETNQVIILFFGDENKLSPESKNCYDQVKDSIPIIQIVTLDDLKQFRIQENVNLICIDSLLGIGVDGEAREPLLSAIKYFNSLKGEKISIDIPSGLNADTGEGNIICDSDLIITFHDLKVGLEKFKDKTVIADIGIPT
jgi:ADP-dependent NAD(P)H-hydrate dehydratase / NAD(P)H-hydrate epimerase